MSSSSDRDRSACTLVHGDFMSCVGCERADRRKHFDPRPLDRDEDVYAEIHAERVRAHEKHGPTSMERLDIDDGIRLAVLTEEVGEVARCLNEARHDGSLTNIAACGLRAELIQVAAMAAAWADAVFGNELPPLTDHDCADDCAQAGDCSAAVAESSEVQAGPNLEPTSDAP